VPNSEGLFTTQSAVFFDDDQVIVGREAARAALLEPEKAAECFKRDMGRKRCRKKVCGKHMRPEVLSAMVLKKLKQDAEEKVGPIVDAVITVPAYFDDARRKATQDAGKIAGLNVVAIINEPTAAAICYGYGKRADPDKRYVVLVYDLGGGTFDATLMHVAGENEFSTIATDGDVMLGGKDWDERLLNYVAGEFVRKMGADPREDPMAYQELALRVEECKRTLSKRQSITIPVVYAGQRLGVPADRAKFRELTADLLARTQTTVEMLVDDAGLGWKQVQAVLLSGGASRMPMVQEMIEGVTDTKPDRTLEEDLAVAKGAALYAASLRIAQQGDTTTFQETAVNRLGGLKHQNVNAHSLGVAARSRQSGRMENVILIPKNTGLPYEKTRTFGLGAAGAGKVRVRVLEGEAPVPEGCVEVGTCLISDLPPNLPKGSPVDVTFSYSEDGRIHVHALAREAHRSASVEIIRPEALSDEEAEEETQEFASFQVV
jgi:molecular chaperone DnaK